MKTGICRLPSCKNKFARAHTGRPRLYCSHLCRKRDERRRKRKEKGTSGA